MRKLAVALCIAGAVTFVAAQDNPAFEVASVKQNTSGDGRILIQTLPGNRITMTNVPARLLVAQAYQLQQFQLVGGPSWLATDRDDIIAKLEGEQKPIVPGTPNPAMLAMRTLLADRFKLTLHRETRDMDVYSLPPVDPDAPSLFTALQEQLGLKLASTKSPVEVTVIDSIEHPADD